MYEVTLDELLRDALGNRSPEGCRLADSGELGDRRQSTASWSGTRAVDDWTTLRPWRCRSPAEFRHSHEAWSTHGHSTPFLVSYPGQYATVVACSAARLSGTPTDRVGWRAETGPVDRWTGAFQGDVSGPRPGD